MGIDRVIERAGVAKATLYSAFGSKDELIRAYLQRQQAALRERITARVSTPGSTPRERILAVYEMLGERMTRPQYRGCAFVNASAESIPGGVVEEVSDEARGWVRSMFAELAAAAGAADPDALSRQLVLLYDGASVGARMDRNPQIAATARAAAGVLVDAAVSAVAEAAAPA